MYRIAHAVLLVAATICGFDGPPACEEPLSQAPLAQEPAGHGSRVAELYVQELAARECDESLVALRDGSRDTAQEGKLFADDCSPTWRAVEALRFEAQGARRVLIAGLSPGERPANFARPRGRQPVSWTQLKMLPAEAMQDVDVTFPADAGLRKAHFSFDMSRG